MSDECHTKTCKKSTAQPVVSSSGTATGASVNLRFGDSTTGTHAAGPVLVDTVSVAGLTMSNQSLAAVNDTDNTAVDNGGAGIFGLGFPAGRYVNRGFLIHRLVSIGYRTQFRSSRSSEPEGK